ncbi:hypothetical protein T440DRAFT_463255 [Plenodomus tracheiphilus IPT5]|uniref:Uncharacterized protein n=1 Tax=Plenodomus tracheiphilus IPT5 TaxID=1408161 RepID=A0A6A7BM77_9PLEO|nr:hypothetical protein T440DRAFT_463255 [Plenodomus tracheiphilus IPT5]
MRISILQTLLLGATVSLPLETIAAPCKRSITRIFDHYILTQIIGKETSQSLHAREADPGFPFIPIPFPKPIIPPFVPKPITPISPVIVPVPPKPVVPAPPKPVEPAPPKPVEPAPPKPITPPPPKPVDPAPPKPQDPILQCKRAPGDACDSESLKFAKEDDEKIRVKGRDSQAALIQKQRSNDPRDVNRPSVSSNYDHQVYDDAPAPISEADCAFLREAPIDVPYSTTEKWRLSTIRNKDNQNPAMENIILQTYERKEDRAIVIFDSRNREKDLAPEQDRLRWSDMVMYNLKNSFDDPSDLRYMVRNTIDQGESAAKTQALIETAIMRTKGDRTKVNVIRSDPKAPGITENELSAYQLVAGSDHCDRVLKMLTDFPETMRNVRIESLSVSTSDTAKAGDEYSIVIKFIKVAEP